MQAKIKAKQLDVDDLVAVLPTTSGGGGGTVSTSVTFDSYHLDHGNLIVTKTTPLITSQVVTNGELIITVA